MKPKDFKDLLKSIDQARVIHLTKKIESIILNTMLNMNLSYTEEPLNYDKIAKVLSKTIIRELKKVKSNPNNNRQWYTKK
jgi:hypothetical protein